MEIWKDVIGYDGLYQVSSTGRVRSLKFDKVRILKPSPDGRGYLHYGLCRFGHQRTIKAHKLVAESFLGHSRCGMKIIVDHIDGNPLNNNVDNLQVVSQRINVYKRKNVESISSKYVGVSLCKKRLVWVAQIYINRTQTYLGGFKCEIEASKAYQIALKDHLDSQTHKTLTNG